MSSKKTWIVLIVLLVVIVAAIGLGIGFYLMFYPQPARIEAGTALEVQTGGALAELPPHDPYFMLFNPDVGNLWDLRQALQYAARDERIASVYLEVQPLQLNWAQIEEVRDELKKFRDSGKPVHAFLAVDVAMEKEIYLASAADTITLNPTAGYIIDGLMAEVTFFKETMNKLGVKPQFIQFKEFKSTESFTRESLSPEVRGMLASILTDIQQRFITSVASDRNIPEATFQQLVDTGMGTSSTALESGLVTALGYKSEVLDQLAMLREGDDGEKPEYKGISIKKYLEAASSRFAERSETRVALLGAMGTISAGDSVSFADVMGGSTMAEHLRKIREDESFSGVLMRVDSPGGSAVGSDMVWREVEMLRQAGKPVVVSMSGVAGSGGYYISMGADRIVSQPSTITGSIGVIFGKFDLSGLFGKLGMTIDRVKVAPNADLLSAFSTLQDDQRARIEEWMEAIYRSFVQKAAEGRGMDYDSLEPRAHGRIYTGNQALEARLVDGLGGFSVAIEQMKESLKLDPDGKIELVPYPKPKSLWETFSSGDLFELNDSVRLVDWVRNELQVLEVPTPWLLAPQIQIR